MGSSGVKDAILASSGVRVFCQVFRELAWNLGSRMLAWPLITLKATARGVDLDMVIRTGGEVRVILHRHRWDGGSLI